MVGGPGFEPGASRSRTVRAADGAGLINPHAARTASTSGLRAAYSDLSSAISDADVLLARSVASSALSLVIAAARFVLAVVHPVVGVTAAGCTAATTPCS